MAAVVVKKEEKVNAVFATMSDKDDIQEFKAKFKEMYPKSKDFGIWAWTYKNIENALEKFKILNGN